MAGIKLRDADEPATDQDRFSQRKRTETGRYLLQIDRQTKGSYSTAELANAAGLAIKTRHPVVQVSVYDTQESTNTLVQLEPATEGAEGR
jgi:hypothetical protein